MISPADYRRSPQSDSKMAHGVRTFRVYPNSEPISGSMGRRSVMLYMTPGISPDACDLPKAVSVFRVKDPRAAG